MKAPSLALWAFEHTSNTNADEESPSGQHVEHSNGVAFEI